MVPNNIQFFFSAQQGVLLFLLNVAVNVDPLFHGALNGADVTLPSIISPPDPNDLHI
jgi:hypothetical protein